MPLMQLLDLLRHLGVYELGIPFHMVCILLLVIRSITRMRIYLRYQGTFKLV